MRAEALLLCTVALAVGTAADDAQRAGVNYMLNCQRRPQ